MKYYLVFSLLIEFIYCFINFHNRKTVSLIYMIYFPKLGANISRINFALYWGCWWTEYWERSWCSRVAVKDLWENSHSRFTGKYFFQSVICHFDHILCFSWHNWLLLQLFVTVVSFYFVSVWVFTVFNSSAGYLSSQKAFVPYHWHGTDNFLYLYYMNLNYMGKLLCIGCYYWLYSFTSWYYAELP